MTQQIINLYEHFKNNKKLKIVCDWDEVIQACEPFAFWKAWNEEVKYDATKTKKEWIDFKGFADDFWSDKSCPIVYSPYGSSLKTRINKENSRYVASVAPTLVEKQWGIKNSPNFYQQAPFLTIAEDLLKLIKEDKVEKLWFLSAYDKGKFPNGDERKREIFNATFEPICFEKWKEKHEFADYRLIMIGFESSEKGQSKVDWIKLNASDFDIVIDDNPNICKSIVSCQECLREETHENDCMGYFKGVVIAPYYPAIEHDKRVILVKNEVSSLGKEDFSK